VFKAQFFGPIGKPDLRRIVVEDVEPVVFKVMTTGQVAPPQHMSSVMYEA
jgi:hypothetical protein